MALAIIGAVFKNGYVKNKVMEFVGPGVSALSADFRIGVDVMTTETTCLSSIWKTDDKIKEFYVELDFEDLHTNYGITNPQLPREGTGRMTFINDKSRGVITTALTDADGNLLSQAQVSGQKFRVFADGQNIELDMDKYIREHRRDFREFCNQSIRDQIEAIKERTPSIPSGHGIPNLSDKACVFFDQNNDAMSRSEQHQFQIGR